MTTSLCIILNLMILFTRTGTSQESDEFNIEISCASKVNCLECIETKDCSWCMDPSIDHNPRCFYSSLTPPYCKDKYNRYHPEFQFNSSKCIGVGTYKCGICECGPNCECFNYGPNCELSS